MKEKSKKNYSAERTKLSLAFYDELMNLIIKWKDRLDAIEILGNMEIAKMTYHKALWKEVFKELL